MTARRLSLVLVLAAAGWTASACESSDDSAFPLRQPLAVKYATPAAGHVVTRDVAEYLSVFAAFSDNLDPSSVGGVALLRDGVPVGGAVEVGPRPHELSVPHGALEVGDYEFVLPASLKSARGDELAVEVRIPFRVEPSADLEL